MKVNKDDIKNSVVWSANVSAPLTRDQQICLMTRVRERRTALRRKSLELLNDQVKKGSNQTLDK